MPRPKFLTKQPTAAKSTGFWIDRPLQKLAFIGGALAAVILGYFILSTWSSGCTGVNLSPGQDIQAAINTNPEGTTFCFAPGTYRLTQVLVPKTGQSYVGAVGLLGERQSIFNGSRLLSTGWQFDGARWFMAGQTQEATPFGKCRADSPRCNRPEELFVNDQRLKHVTSLANVTAGTWYFDYAADRIYISQDPTGTKVETSVTPRAFYADGPNNNTFKNLIIEKYASPSSAALKSNNNWGWVIDNVEARLNHFNGIGISGSTTVRNSYSHHNGQMGIGGGKYPGGIVTNNLIENNEVSYNNQAGFNEFWEAGGSKFAFNDSLTIRGNYYHHNKGYAIWLDIDNINIVIEGNRSEDNELAGIHYEISYGAVIRNNILKRNGTATEGWGGAGIYVLNSPNVEIYGNTLEGNKWGIVGYMENRGSGRYGLYEIANFNVHDNTTTYGSGGRTGLIVGANVTGYESYWITKNNRFKNNKYYLPSSSDTGANWFTWRGDKNFPQWQGFGHDTTGSIAVASTAPADTTPPSAPAT